MSEPLVDLLLVRLGGEEEKKKVTRLLVTELDMTVGEAETAVTSSPVVIRESVSIGEARVIQKNLYPYIDLLPRLEEEESNNLKDRVRSVSSPVDPEDSSVEELPPGDDTDQDHGIPDDTAEDEEDDFLLTTASDEMLQIERCHICGKTPVGGEKLAPCRTCGDLTCRDCFDRTVHVCQKCAAEGQSVDRPMAARPSSGTEAFRATEPALSPASGGGTRESNRIRAVVMGAILVAALVLFYFMDPLGILATHDTSCAAGTDHSHVPHIQPDSALPDTAVTVPPPDTTAQAPSTADPLGIGALSPPDPVSPEFLSREIQAFTRIPAGVPAASATQELSEMLPHLQVIAGNAGIYLDRAALLVYGDPDKLDHVSVLVLAVNHPENSEDRLSFISGVADWLIPSNVSQFVFFYRETRFHQPQPFSYRKQSFPEIAGATNPVHFRDAAGTHESVWESIAGPVMEWICEM